MVPQLSSGWQHNYSTKTRQAGQANDQYMYSLMFMVATDALLVAGTDIMALNFANGNTA